MYLYLWAAFKFPKGAVTSWHVYGLCLDFNGLPLLSSLPTPLFFSLSRFWLHLSRCVKYSMAVVLLFSHWPAETSNKLPTFNWCPLCYFGEVAITYKALCLLDFFIYFSSCLGQWICPRVPPINDWKKSLLFLVNKPTKGNCSTL